MELSVRLPPCSMQSTVHATAKEQLTNASSLRSNAIHPLSMLLPMQMGTWCSGITSASHAEGPGFKSQCVHFSKLLCIPSTMFRLVLRVPLRLRCVAKAWQESDRDSKSDLRLSAHACYWNLQGQADGHMVQWYHTRLACGRPWVQSPVCPLLLRASAVEARLCKSSITGYLNQGLDRC